jgi:hypothetical protein
MYNIWNESAAQQHPASGNLSLSFILFLKLHHFKSADRIRGKPPLPPKKKNKSRESGHGKLIFLLLRLSLDSLKCAAERVVKSAGGRRE